jgi:hypothetical protein
MLHRRHKHSVSFQSNAKLAQSLWGNLSKIVLDHLKELTRKHQLSIAAGDLQLLEGRWYVTHGGLLRIAERHRCAGIRTSVERHLSDSNLRRWVCKCVAYKKGAGKSGFTGYGDADPSNVAPSLQGAELRVAETRAVSRALRKAYGIATCSVEELGSFSGASDPFAAHAHSNGHHGTTIGQPQLRDKLGLLIRRYELDPNLVKRYAADFCGTETLRDASRDLVEAFVSTVAKEAANDRAALICKLNSYCQPEEVRS